MKKYFFSLLVVCLFAFTACSNEDGLTPSINQIENDLSNQRNLGAEDEEMPELQRSFQQIDPSLINNKKTKKGEKAYPIGTKDKYEGGDETDPPT